VAFATAGFLGSTTAVLDEIIGFSIGETIKLDKL
jgi:hypothetical protein